MSTKREQGVAAAKALKAQQAAVKAPPPPPNVEINNSNVDLIKPIEQLTEKVVECRDAMPAQLDVGPVVEAIKQINPPNVVVDLEKVAETLRETGKVDVSGIESAIGRVKKSMDEGNKLMTRLIEVSEAARVVEYDVEGRIVKIKVEQ